MDFNKLINDLLAQGEDIDELAKDFTEALNAANAANKSKKEKDKYIANTREAVIKDLSREQESFSTAAAVAMIVTARTYPKMTIKDLQNYEVATREAMTLTAKFHNDTHYEGESILSSLMDILPGTTPKKTDEEKIADFVRRLG